MGPPTPGNDLYHQMRAGIRSAIDRMADRVRAGAHPTLTTVLCAGACAPVVAAAVGTGAATVAVLGAVGGVGGGVLAKVLTDAVERLKVGRRDAPAPDEIERLLIERFDAMLAQETETAGELRRDMAAVLSDIGAVRIVVETAFADFDETLREFILDEFRALAAEFDEFRFLLSDTRLVIDEINRTLHRQEQLHRAARDQSQRQSTQLQLILDRLETAPPALDSPSPEDAAFAQQPYLGLWPFAKEQAAVFFGRERLTAALVDRLASCLESSGILAVTGTSGAGKSSLLHAGVIPAVGRGRLSARGSEHWPAVTMTPGSSPLKELAARLANLAGLNAVDVYRSISEHPDRAGLLVRQELADDRVRDRARLLLVVDQFEELYTLGCGETERRAFIAALASIAGGGTESAGLVVFAVRGDFVDRCAESPELAQVLQNDVFIVGPMTSDELRQAITGPAAVAHLLLDEGLADDILADLRGAVDGEAFGPAALPLLSQTMLMIWHRRNGDRLSRRSYASFGGVSQAVQASAEAVFTSLGEDQRRTAKALFRRLVIVDRDGRLARRPARRDELAETGVGSEAVLEAFTAERLVVLGEVTAEIAHDALLRHWPRLITWMEEDRRSLGLRTQLIADAEEWHDRGRDPSFLYRGLRLDAVERDRWNRWRSNPDRFPPLGASALLFLEASRAHRERGRRIRRAVASALAVLLILLSTATGLALGANELARDQRDQAVSGQLADASFEAGQTDGELARNLAAAAWEVYPSEAARRALQTAYGNPLAGTITGHLGHVRAMKFSPDGSLFASGDSTGRVALWDTADWTQVDHFVAYRFEPSEFVPEPTGIGVGDVQFSPDGETIATGTEDGVIRLWDVGSDEPKLTIDDVPLSGGSAFSPDGTRLTAFGESTTYVWDTTTGEQLAAFEQPDGVAAVEFSGGGSNVMSLLTSGVIRIEAIEDGELDETPPVILGSSGQLVFSPDGSALAVAGHENTVVIHLGEEIAFSYLDRLASPVVFGRDSEALLGVNEVGALGAWDIESGAQIGAMPLPETYSIWESSFLAADPNSDMVVRSNGQSIQILDLRLLEHGTVTEINEEGEHSQYQQLDYLPDRTGLLVGSERGLRHWDVDESGQLIAEDGVASSTRYSQPGAVVTASPDGALIASGDIDGSTVSVRRTDSGELVESMSTRGDLRDLEFSPDGTVLAVASSIEESEESGAGPVELWDTADWEVADLPAGDDITAVNSLVFSADGERLVLGYGGRVATVEIATGAEVESLDGDYSVANLARVGDTGYAAASTAGVLYWSAGERRPGVLLGVSDYGAVDIAVSPNGRYLAANEGFQGVISIWELETGALIRTLSGFGVVHAVEFSPDNSTLAAVGDELHTWDVAFLDTPYASVCRQIHRDLTSEERATLLADLPVDIGPVCQS